MNLINLGDLTEHGNSFEMTAFQKTDYFIDRMNNIENNNAPFAYLEMGEEFSISACVKPEFKSTYDAGGLFVLDNSKKWIKLEFELTDLGYPSIVSVVTDGTSDDCNGEKMEGFDKVFLQIIRRNDYWVLHHSMDGENWKMNRYFRLEMSKTVKVGFEVQSPISSGSRCLFTEVKIGNTEVVNLRTGK